MQKNIETPPVTIRPYSTEDAKATHDLFAVTVETAYSEAAWERGNPIVRPGQRALEKWDFAIKGKDGVVAVVGEIVVGFSGVSTEGHVDVMFVSPHHADCGVARKLMNFLEMRAEGRSDFTAGPTSSST